MKTINTCEQIQIEKDKKIPQYGKWRGEPIRYIVRGTEHSDRPWNAFGRRKLTKETGTKDKKRNPSIATEDVRRKKKTDNPNVKYLIMLYTNADCLMNKIHELIECITTEKLHIVFVTEVNPAKPTYCIHTTGVGHPWIRSNHKCLWKGKAMHCYADKGPLERHRTMHCPGNRVPRAHCRGNQPPCRGQTTDNGSVQEPKQATGKQHEIQCSHERYWKTGP